MIVPLRITASEAAKMRCLEQFGTPLAYLQARATGSLVF